MHMCRCTHWELNYYGLSSTYHCIRAFPALPICPDTSWLTQSHIISIFQRQEYNHKQMSLPKTISSVTVILVPTCTYTYTSTILISICEEMSAGSFTTAFSNIDSQGVKPSWKLMKEEADVCCKILPYYAKHFKPNFAAWCHFFLVIAVIIQLYKTW